MNFNLKNFSLILAGIACSQSLLAAPALNPKCKVPNLSNPKNASGVLFDETCSTAYVLPPTQGKAEIKGLTRTTNLNFCPAVKQAGKVASKTLESADIAAGKIKEMISNFQPLDNDLIQIRDELAILKAKKDAASETKNRVDNILKELKSDYKELALKVDECFFDLAKGRTTAAVCNSLKSSQDDLDQKIEYLRNGEHRSAVRTALQTQQDFDGKANLLAERDALYINATKPLFELLDKIFELNSKINELYREYSAMDGSTGQLSYSVEWDQILEQYKQMNTNKSLTWQKLPIKKANFWAYVKQGQTDSTGIPALRWSRIPGDNPIETSGIKSLDQKPSSSDQDQLASVVFGNSISAQIGLTLAGACPYFTDMNTVDRNVNAQELTAHMVANAGYTYELQARRSYHAEYSLSQMISRLEKRVKKGGFFSSRTAHEVVEDNSSSDWFRISFNADSGEFNYTPSEQQLLTKDVKANIMDRALKNFAMLNTGLSTPPSVPGMNPTGASVFASNLRGCFNWYCQAGSLVFGTLDSIFGRSEAVSNFKKTNSSWVSEDVNGLAIIERASSLTFTPSK